MTQVGRVPPEPARHTFPNGATATIRRMSQFTIASLEIGIGKAYPKPAPPLAPGIGGAMEPNPADPEYAAAVQRWQLETQLRVMDAMLDYAVDIEVDQAALDDVRTLFERVGAPLDEISDKVAYIKHCCVFDLSRDLSAVSALIRDGIPTEADVQAHVETFRGDVERNGHLSNPRAARQSADEPVV